MATKPKVDNEKVTMASALRLARLSEKAFDIVYKTMCYNDDISTIYLYACVGAGGDNGTVGEWLPEAFFDNISDVGPAKMVIFNITPSSINTMELDDGVVGFECRKDGRSVWVPVPADSVMAVLGFDATDTIVDVHEFPYLIKTAIGANGGDEQPPTNEEEQPPARKRNHLSLVQ